MQNTATPTINAADQAEMRLKVNSFKMDQLKIVLAELNLAKSGRKAELVARIFNFWSSQISLANLARLKTAIELAMKRPFATSRYVRVDLLP